MESHSRGRVQGLSRFDRIDDRPLSVQQITKHLGFPVVDLFASQINHQTPEFVSWRGNSNRCFQYPVGPSTELSVSSFWSDTNVPKEGNAGAGRLLSHCSSREELAMVSSTPIHAYRASSAMASGSENPEAPRTGRIHPLCCQKKIPVSCLEATQPNNMVVLGKAGVADIVGKGLIFFLQL